MKFEFCGQIKEKLQQLSEKRKEMMFKWDDRWDWLRLREFTFHSDQTNKLNTAVSHCAAGRVTNSQEKTFLDNRFVVKEYWQAGRQAGRGNKAKTLQVKIKNIRSLTVKKRYLLKLSVCLQTFIFSVTITQYVF